MERDLSELAVECLGLALGRKPTEEEVQELRRPKSSAELAERAAELRRLASDLARDRAERVSLRDRVDPEDEVTVSLPVHFGSAAAYVAAVERGARDNGVDCTTQVSRTGLLSKRVDFTFRARRLRLELFLAALKDWADAAGIGWRAV